MSKQFVLATAVLMLGTPLFAADKVMPIEPPMVDIKGGEFMMGGTDKPNSQPLHAVTIKPFRMGKYEVTIEEFRRFMQASGYTAPVMCQQMATKNWFVDVPGEYPFASSIISISKFEPATCVGWPGANAYVAWLAKETGKQYRLPTEAEWEYAHRAGSTTKYFWGDDEALGCRYANLGDRSAEVAMRRDYGLETKGHVGVVGCDDKAGYASIVGMYQPNAFGLYDTLGNLGEYLQDCWSEDYKGASKDGSAMRGGDCTKHALRGGTWHWGGFGASARFGIPDTWIGSLEGFRVAQSIDSDSAPPAKAAPSTFEVALAQAQQAERARRSTIAELKPAN